MNTKRKTLYVAALIALAFTLFVGLNVQKQSASNQIVGGGESSILHYTEGVVLAISEEEKKLSVLDEGTSETVEVYFDNHASSFTPSMVQIGDKVLVGYLVNQEGRRSLSSYEVIASN